MLPLTRNANNHIIAARRCGTGRTLVVHGTPRCAGDRCCGGMAEGARQLVQGKAQYRPFARFANRRYRPCADSHFFQK